MSEFNNNILKQNVRMLLKNNGMTQGQLAEILGMAQPNVCKALSDTDKKCFTIAQIYDIADYFQVSIDWLVGHSQEQLKLSKRSAAEFIAKLLELHIASSCDITIKEHVYLPEWENNPSKDYDKTSVYPAIYFSHFWQPDQMAKQFEDIFPLTAEAQKHGNFTKNTDLNEFLDNHQQILDLYHKSQIQKEHYQIILKDYLQKLSSDSIQEPAAV